MLKTTRKLKSAAYHTLINITIGHGTFYTSQRDKLNKFSEGKNAFNSSRTQSDETFLPFRMQRVKK